MLMLLCVPILQTNKKNLVEEKKQLSNVDKQKIGEFAKKTMNFLFKKSN